MWVPSTRPVLKGKLTSLWIVGVFLLLIIRVQAQAVVLGQNFGYTQGSFSVSDAGAATYHIPFVIPAGTAGLQPKIGLTYSSQAGNSFVGLGWSLAGLSSITRSTKTRAQDEISDAVQQTKAVSLGINYTTADRFSLDGERLVLTPESSNTTIAFDGNYGNDQTTYYTEQNSFTRVQLIGSDLSTQYFKAFTKSGLIFEYGNTTNNTSASRVIDPTKNVAYQWLVNRIEDRKGNYITFSYTQYPNSGEVYPDEIQYTGNTAGSLIPYNRVKFIWADRPDVSSVYGIRYQSKNTFRKILESVQVFYQTTLVREYKLSYTNTTGSTYSLLERVQECDGSNPNQVCLEATTFKWSNVELGQGIPVEVVTVPTTTTPEKRLFGDFNGDGLTDIATWDIPASTSNIIFRFFLNTGNSGFSESVPSSTTTNIGGGDQLTVQTGELNGDNINDIVVTWRPQPNPASGNNCLFLISNPSPPVNNAPYSYTCSYYTKLVRIGDTPWDDIIQDVNGDGLSDFIDYQTEASTNKPILAEARLAINLPTNTTAVQTYYPAVLQPNLVNTGYNAGWSSTAQPDKIFDDINNDGITDLFIFDKTDGKNAFIFGESQQILADAANRKNQFQVRFGLTSSYSQRSLLQQSWLSGVANKINLVDLNSDNLPDILVVKPSANQVCIIPNKGDRGFENQPNHICYPVQASILSSFSNVIATDFNADGLTDITLFETTGGTSRTYLNQGGNFSFNFLDPKADVWPLERFKDTGTNPRPQIGSFQKGSHSDLLYYTPAQNKWFLRSQRQSQGITIKKITNGAGLVTEVRYDNLLNSAFYEKAGQVTFPNVDIQSPLYVVSKIKTISATSDETAKKYRYCGATINVEGRGFRGFTKIIETDTITGIYDARYYRQGADQWKYTGQTVIKTERFYQNDVLISRTAHNPVLIGYPTANPTSFQAYAKEEITEDFVNSKVQKIRKLNDNYGNPLYVTVDYGEGLKDSTANTYADNYANWLLGRLTQATVYKFTGQTTEIRQAAFEYDGTTGLLTKETSDINLAADQRVVKTYTYDTFGNITQSNTNAWNGSTFQDRPVQTTYDALTKRFIVQTVNSLGHTATATYEQKFGLPLLETDPNSLTVGYEYDGFSRLVKQSMPDGTWKAIAYRKASTSTFQSPPEAVFLTYTQSSAGQEMVEQFDSYNRSVQTKSRGLYGRWILVDHTYSRVTSPDVREIIKDNFPYYEGEISTGYSQKELDVLGRVVAMRETKTGGIKTVSTNYGGPITDVLNYKNQKKTDIDDAKGRIVESRWNDGNNVYFTYDASGRLLTTRDLKGNTITNQYDARGYKIRMTDPDMGSYQYEYNSFGELTKQTYPNGKVVTMTYDVLGRLLTRVDNEGATTNTYDTGNKALGKLSSVSSYVSSHTYTYDIMGRKAQEGVTVNGQTYTTAYDYDSQSRISALRYPASGLVLKHIYNAYGFLTELRNNSPDALFWHLDSLDSKGNVTLQSFGNGVKTRRQYEDATQYLRTIQTFNSTGNATLQQFSYRFNDLAHLTTRTDDKRGKTETFAYDDVNRLATTTIDNTVATTLTYDVLGNITYKSDVGYYEYGTANNGPHRLVNVRTNNANVQCSFTLNINTVYTSFNKVQEISNDTAKVEVFYGPDQQRIMQKMYVRGTLTRTKLYIGGLTEIEIFNGKTKTTNFIGGIGMQVTEVTSTTTTTIKYYLKDHLGSITGFTGDGGTLLEELSFDAWGQRRDPTTWVVTAFIGSHERGFTNHEHYDLFAMIDMNGRVYDPVLGRFLQPDPFIQDITDLQDLNRYSYVGNNPLSYTDPTGYKKWWKKITHWFKPLAIIAIAVVTGGIAAPALASAIGLSTFGAFVFSGAAAGFASNVAGTLANGGGLSDALKSGLRGAIIGGVSAGLTYGVGTLAESPFKALSSNPLEAEIKAAAWESSAIKFLGQATLQGGMAEVTGGEFRQGFISSTLSSIISPRFSTETNVVLRATVSAIIGGSISELTGGSFSNGATTSAFAEMFTGLIESPKYNKFKGYTFGTPDGASAPLIGNGPRGVFKRFGDAHDIRYGTVGSLKFVADFRLGWDTATSGLSNTFINASVGIIYFTGVTVFGGVFYDMAQQSSYYDANFKIQATEKTR